MANEFEIRREIELAASPEQVWEAVATGPGHGSWFMGPYDIEPKAGGAISFRQGDERTEAGTVTGWDPPHLFAHRTPEGEDGSFHAFEFLIEGRDGGTTVLRFIHSGATGDDWSDEYESMTGQGWDMYLFTLSEYLTYFPGRYATYVTAQGPTASAAKDAWPALERGLGLTGPVAVGDAIRLAPAGFDPIDGVVDYDGPEFLGVRTGDGFYRFHGLAPLNMPIAVGHHLFGDVDGEKTNRAWETWLHGLFPAAK